MASSNEINLGPVVKICSFSIGWKRSSEEDEDEDEEKTKNHDEEEEK